MVVALFITGGLLAVVALVLAIGMLVAYCHGFIESGRGEYRNGFGEPLAWAYERGFTKGSRTETKNSKNKLKYKR